MPGDKLVSISVGLYRMLLRVYPRTHREAYGPLMLQVFRDACRDAYRREGTGGLVHEWMHTLLDAVPSLIVEYCSELERGGWLNMDERTARKRRALTWIISGLPVALGLALTLLNPQYMGRMVLYPHARTQPLGWIFTASIVVLAGLTYWTQRASLALTIRSGRRSAAGILLAVGSALFFALPAVCLVIFGPALLRLVELGVLGSAF